MNFTCKSNRDFNVKRNNSKGYCKYFKLVYVPSSLTVFLIDTQNIGSEKFNYEFIDNNEYIDYSGVVDFFFFLMRKSLPMFMNRELGKLPIPELLTQLKKKLSHYFISLS